MEIRFCVTGANRKALVMAMAELTGHTASYRKAPSFAFDVGEYHIDKNGTVNGPDDQALLNALADKGYADPESGAAYQLEELSVPAPVITMPELLPQRNPGQDYDADFLVSASQVAQGYDLVIEYPLEGFGDTEINNLEKMIASKAPLLRAALGAEDLSFYETESTLQFPWFSGEVTGEEVKAYTQLIAALCQAAKKLKRVTAKERTVDNEKYAFRCFLLRLGFIGDEYKPMRKILLQNLSGNGSFKSGSRKAREDAPGDPVDGDGGTAAQDALDVGPDATGEETPDALPLAEHEGNVDATEDEATAMAEEADHSDA